MSKLTVPSLTSEQMKEVDDLMVKFYNIDILQMMEHDARGLAEVAKLMFRGSLKGKKVLVVAGKGGNGAGGLASARHLHNAGAKVSVVLAGSARSLSKEGRHHLKTLKKISVPVKVGLGILPRGTRDPAPISSGHPMFSRRYTQSSLQTDLVLDALLGYSAQGDPRPPYDELILLINELQRQGAKVLANDLPSGLDPVSGLPHKPCVRADATMTVALPKTGLLEYQAREWVGELYLTDIGVPPELYAKMGVGVDQGLFDEEWVLKLI